MNSVEASHDPTAALWVKSRYGPNPKLARCCTMLASLGGGSRRTWHAVAVGSSRVQISRRGSAPAEPRSASLCQMDWPKRSPAARTRCQTVLTKVLQLCLHQTVMPEVFAQAPGRTAKISPVELQMGQCLLQLVAVLSWRMQPGSPCPCLAVHRRDAQRPRFQVSKDLLCAAML